MTIRTRVAIIGAGPVGAVAAYRLATFGIDSILIEANASCPEDMRASTFHPPSLDMMEDLGIVDALIADGIRAPIYRYRNRRTGNSVSLDLSELADEVRHPYRLQCEQYKLARLLAAKLADHPHGKVLFSHRLLAMEQDADGVTVQVEGPTAIETIRCDYLIGADGANSTVRKWLSLSFEGFTWPERFLTLSTDFPIEDHLEGLADVNYVADAEEWCVLLRVPGLWRILVPTLGTDTDAELLSDAKKTRVFEGLIGQGEDVKTYHRTLYRVHQRVAETFRRGRVILAGDSAHLNNPLGGFGMNSGLHDAWNLTTKLRDILLDGGNSDALLDRYDRQRRTISREFVQSQTIQNKRAMEEFDEHGQSGMERQLLMLSQDPPARRAYLRKQAMIESLKREAEIQ